MEKQRPLSYNNTDVFLLLFSILSRTSFNNIKTKWHPEVNHHWCTAKNFVVGTKCDLRHDQERLAALRDLGMEPVSREEGERIATELDCQGYLECSALKRVGLK